jgi:DNA invertase Pin-like site-specific DNA recombinase
MKYGYARVSSDGQDLTIQEEVLTAAGCDLIRSEKKSGTTVEGRSELRVLLRVASRPRDRPERLRIPKTHSGAFSLSGRS